MRLFIIQPRPFQYLVRLLVVERPFSPAFGLLARLPRVDDIIRRVYVAEQAHRDNPRPRYCLNSVSINRLAEVHAIRQRPVIVAIRVRAGRYSFGSPAASASL